MARISAAVFAQNNAAFTRNVYNICHFECMAFSCSFCALEKRACTTLDCSFFCNCGRTVMVVFKSKANLVVQIFFHACFDAQYSFYSHYIPDAQVPNAPFNQGWTYILSYCLLAFVIIIVTRGRLGYNPVQLNLDKYFGEKKHRYTMQALQTLG
jgi:hypothetical protein